MEVEVQAYVTSQSFNFPLSPTNQTGHWNFNFVRLEKLIYAYWKGFKFHHLKHSVDMLLYK